MFLKQLGLPRPASRICRSSVAAAARSAGRCRRRTPGWAAGRCSTRVPHPRSFRSGGAGGVGGVPLIVSTTLGGRRTRPEQLQLSEAGSSRGIEQRFQAKARKSWRCTASSIRRIARISCRRRCSPMPGFAARALRQAELKAIQGRGAIYVYEWDWPSPPLEAAMGPCTVSRSPLPFARPAKATTCPALRNSWPPPGSRSPAAAIPRLALLPAWPTYDAQSRATMVFGTPTQLINDHRGEIRTFWDHMPAGGPCVEVFGRDVRKLADDSGGIQGWLLVRLSVGAAQPPRAHCQVRAQIRPIPAVPINLLNFFDRQLLGALGEPVRQEFQLKRHRARRSGTVFTLIYAFVGLPLGALSDRWYRTRLIAFGTAFWSLLTAATGFAQSTRRSSSRGSAWASGEATCAPAGQSLIGDFFPADPPRLRHGRFHVGAAGRHFPGLPDAGADRHEIGLARGLLFCLRARTDLGADGAASSRSRCAAHSIRRAP